MEYNNETQFKKLIGQKLKRSRVYIIIMVKSINGKDIPRYSMESRLFLLLFASKNCGPCHDQESDLDALEVTYRKLHGVKFRKLDIKSKEVVVKTDNGDKIDILKKFGISSVPTVMIWVKGVQTAFQFEPNGKIVDRIEGKIKKDILYREINHMLQATN